MNVKLSKTRFIAGRQCELRLWNDVHRRDLATAWSDAQQAIFDRGTRIGELAQARYPGGVLVGYKPWEREPAIAETQRLMAYENALETSDAGQREQTCEQLRAYCKQDTLAMVQLYDALNEIAENNEGERE